MRNEEDRVYEERKMKGVWRVRDGECMRRRDGECMKRRDGGCMGSEGWRVYGE